MQNKIKSLASDFNREIVDIRRHLHANPELSKQEFETARFITNILREWGIECKEGIGGTGVVGLIKGNNPEKKCIALRADMDALPILEKNDIPYKSLKRGVMHACGHDAHISSLLGCAKILNELKNEFEGSVKLIFQPSEETYPGGALPMIQEGVLANPKPDVIFGTHVFPEMDAGKVGMRPGKYMASTDEIFLTVKGKGGHGAIPDQNIDPILIACHIIIALQQIVSRNAKPTMPTVISFGKISGDGKTNVVPNEVKIEGIIRTFNEEWRAEIKRKIRKISESVAESMGGSCEVFIDQGYPFLVNDKELTARTFKYANEFLGDENVEELELRMTAEDFAYFSQQIPGCYYRLGTRNEKLGITSNLHTNTFNIDESSLETGMGLMAWLTYCELNS